MVSQSQPNNDASCAPTREAYANLEARLHRFVDGENPRTIYKLPPNGRLDPLRGDVAALFQRVWKLELTAQRVLDGLNARIDAACAGGGDSVPVFDGIADLAGALGPQNASLKSREGT